MTLLDEFRSDPEVQRIRRESEEELDRLRAKHLGMSYKEFIMRRDFVRGQNGRRNRNNSL